MENSCFYEDQVFRRCQVLKIRYLDGKQLFYQNQVFRKCRALKINYLDGKQLFTSQAPVMGEGLTPLEEIQYGVLVR